MEYGSDFSIDLGKLEPTDDTVFRYLSDFHALYFDSGRSATQYLLHTLRPHRVALPRYLCESISHCFADTQTLYYPLNDRLQIRDLKKIPWDKIDVFYLLHYFGSLQPDDVLEYVAEMRQRFGFTVMEDTTHSLFTAPLTIGDFGVCSLRKWFAVPDGGVLYAKRRLDRDAYDSLRPIQSPRIGGMVLKSLYLQGIVTNKSDFRKILIDTEDALDKQKKPYRLSAVSDFLLRCQSTRSIAEKRIRNHAAIQAALGDLYPEAVIRKDGDVPFTYLIRTKDRDALRAYLIQNEIYCPVHWPLPEGWEQEAKRLSGEMLSIPIDQRYTESDMRSVTNIIRGFHHE